MTILASEDIEMFSETEMEYLQFLPEELEEIESEQYRDLESISLEEVASDLEAFFEEDFEEEELEASKRRRIAVGATPSKKSKTGRQVLNRWQKKDKARRKGNSWQVFVKDRSGKRRWMPLDRNIHMGHKLAAVNFWNKGARGIIGKKPKYRARYGAYSRPGYKTGFRSPYVRKFMRDSRNYRFEYGRVNSSAGAKMKARYRLPVGKKRWPR